MANSRAKLELEWIVGKRTTQETLGFASAKTCRRTRRAKTYIEPGDLRATLPA